MSNDLYRNWSFVLVALLEISNALYRIFAILYHDLFRLYQFFASYSFERELIFKKIFFDYSNFIFLAFSMDRRLINPPLSPFFHHRRFFDDFDFDRPFSRPYWADQTMMSGHKLGEGLDVRFRVSLIDKTSTLAGGQRQGIFSVVGRFAIRARRAEGKHR